MTAVVGSVLLLASAAQAVACTLLDQRISGPLIGVLVCVDSTCDSESAVKDLHVVVTLDIASVSLPSVTLGPAAVCAGTFSLVATIASVGASGTVDGGVSFQPVDENGDDSGPRVTMPLGPAPVSEPPSTHTIYICGSPL